MELTNKTKDMTNQEQQDPNDGGSILLLLVGIGVFLFSMYVMFI